MRHIGKSPGLATPVRPSDWRHNTHGFPPYFSRQPVRTTEPALRGLLNIDPSAVKALLRFGVCIHLATLVITLREPIYKILIARFCDMESLASFEISYRLCTQLVSIVVSPLLGTFAVSALLQHRQGELEKILRHMVGFNCAIFIPAILLFGSFSEELISFWLGKEANSTAFMTFVMFTGFALYYLTQPLYKSLEGTGMSGYSALVQTFGLLVSTAILIGYSGQGEIAIPISLFAGFVVVSICNYLVFSRRFKEMSLIAPRKLLLLLVPPTLYVLSSSYVSAHWLPVIFLLYLLLHFLVVAKTGIFDYMKLSGKIYELGRSKLRRASIAARVP